jgi:hypothetical protein
MAAGPCDRAETKPKPKKTALWFGNAEWLQYFLNHVRTTIANVQSSAQHHWFIAG